SNTILSAPASFPSRLSSELLPNSCFIIPMAAAASVPSALSLHAALPISLEYTEAELLARDTDSITHPEDRASSRARLEALATGTDRKSTRLNSSHVKTSYAGFCLKKKKTGAENRRAHV